MAIENDVEDLEPTNINENTDQETSLIKEEKENIDNAQTDNYKSNNLSTIIETVTKSQEVLSESINNDNFNENINQVLETSKEFKIDDSEPKTNSNTSADLESIKDNESNNTDLTTINEQNCVKPLDEDKNNDLVTEIIKNKVTELNISEEEPILDDSTENSVQVKSSTAITNVQVNGEILSADHKNTEHNFDKTVKNHDTPDDSDTETQKTEAQNNINTLLTEDLKVNVADEENDNKLPLIINAKSDENVDRKINGNFVNQDSISNSSDSETIANSETLLQEINGDNTQTDEQKAIAQPISVITVLTSETMDSDCSEAYLTPNELNDTPKKMLETISLTVNDDISICKNDVVPKLNPSMESNHKNIITPSENASETIVVDVKSNNEDINCANVYKDKAEEITLVNEAAVNVEENNTDKKIKTVEKIDGNVDNLDKNEIVENSKETEIKNKEEFNIVLQPHKEHTQSNNVEGMFY